MMGTQLSSGTISSLTTTTPTMPVRPTHPPTHPPTQPQNLYSQ